MAAPATMVERVALALAVDHYARRFGKPRNDAHVCENANKNAAFYYDSALVAIEAMPVPTEAMWGGLARDIVMWMDMCDGGRKTPRNLFKHLEMKGRAIPQWLRDEPEMTALDHVPSKGTRAAIIYRAMIDAALKTGGE